VAKEPTLDMGALDRWRDEVWHRTPGRKVTDEVSALRYLAEVSCCLAFGGYDVGVPTLWVAACGERAPAFPKHSHHDAAVGLVWSLKDTLADADVAYYGRLFLRKPSFVARPWLATVVAASPERTLSPAAGAILETLRQTGPLGTEELRQRAGFASRKALVAALEEAQGALAVARVEVRYDPWTYVWGTFDQRYAADQAEAEQIPQGLARRKLVRLWVRLLGVVSPARLATILGWPTRVVEEAVRPLVAEGTLRDDVRIEGRPGAALADRDVYDLIRGA